MVSSAQEYFLCTLVSRAFYRAWTPDLWRTIADVFVPGRTLFGAAGCAQEDDKKEDYVEDKEQGNKEQQDGEGEASAAMDVDSFDDFTVWHRPLILLQLHSPNGFLSIKLWYSIMAVRHRQLIVLMP